MIRACLAYISPVAATLSTTCLTSGKAKVKSMYEPLLDMTDEAVTDLGDEVVMVLTS